MTTIRQLVHYIDIETLDSVDTKTSPEIIPCFTVHDSVSYHIFSFGFKSYELSQVSLRLYQYWSSNLISKLQKYNFSNPRLIFHNHETERAMLGDFLNFIRQSRPDIICVWNATFDMPYLVQRMKNLQIPTEPLSEISQVYKDRNDLINIGGIASVDAMTGYANLQLSELYSKSLDYCANREFGIGKMSRTSIKEMRQRDPVGLLAYNVVDVMLTSAMTQECQIIDQQQTISKIANVGLGDVSPTQLVDAFIMSFLKDRNRKIMLPTTVHEKASGKKEGGAFVKEVIIGKHKNVIILDYKGMYPSIMMSGNMCMSTILTKDEIKEGMDYVKCPNGAMFRKDKKGIIPEILEHLKVERAKYKKLEAQEQDKQLKNVYYLIQYGYKVISNIFYGQFKNPHFRLMNKDIAEAVTSVGVTLITQSIDLIEKVNLSDIIQEPQLKSKLSGQYVKVIYGDTDSVFIKLPEYLSGQELNEIGMALEKYINSLIPLLVKNSFNITNSFIEIEYDNKKIMKALLQMPSKTDKERGAKKRYIYLAYDKNFQVDPKPQYKGIESARSDTSPMVVEIQTQLSKLILNDKPYNEVRTYLLNLYNKFSKTDPHQLLIKETIHAFDNAKSHSPQLIGALYANKFMSKSFKSGSSVYYVYLKSFPKGYPTHIQTNNWGNQKAVALCLAYNETIPSQFMAHIDFDKMRELVLENPVEGIIEAIGYSWSNILSGMSENKMKPITAVTLNNRQSLVEI